jgi:hypothetical protein
MDELDKLLGEIMFNDSMDVYQKDALDVKRTPRRDFNYVKSPIDSVGPNFSSGSILGPTPFEEEPGLYGQKAQRMAKQGEAMLDVSDPSFYLKQMGMRPDVVEVLEYTGMMTPFAVANLDNLMRKLFKKSVKDAKIDEIKQAIKVQDDLFKPKKPEGKPAVDKDGEIILKPYKPKGERQLDSAKARLYDVLLDDDDLNVDLIPYNPKK